MRSHGKPRSNDDPRHRAEAIQSACQRHILAARAKTLQRCKEVHQKALTRLEHIEAQYRRQAAGLTSLHAKEVELVSHEHHTLEIANEVSLDQLRRYERQAKDLLIRRQLYESVKPSDFPGEEDNNKRAPIDSFDTQFGIVEQLYQDLVDLCTPRVFRGNRPLMAVMGYAFVAAFVLVCLYGYEILSPHTLYYSLPMVVILAFIVLGGGGALLRRHMIREIRDLHGQFTEELEPTYAFLEQEAQQIQEALDQALSELQRAQEARLDQLEQVRMRAYSQIRLRKDAEFGDLGRDLLATESDLRSQRDEALRRAGTE